MADGVKQFRTRIGRVIGKNGADLKVIEGKFQWHGHAAEAVDGLEEATRNIVEYLPDLAGYVIMGWDPAGRYTLGYRCTPASPIPAVFIPAFVAEVVRQNINTNAAVDWINGR